MAAFHAHGPLVAFLHGLDANTAAGATKEFLAALGRKLVVAQLIPEEEFARTGAPSAADLGCLMNRLHTMGPIINWAVEPDSERPRTQGIRPYALCPLCPVSRLLIDSR